MATNYVSAEVSGGDDVLASQYNNLRQDALESGGDFEVTAGAGDAYTLAVDSAISAYKEGQVFRFEADEANTGGATLNVNGIGAVSILKNVSDALETGDILVGQTCYVMYDGTFFQMLSVTEAISKAQAAILKGGTTSDADTLHTHKMSKRLNSGDSVTVASTAAETTILTGTVSGGTLGTANAVKAKLYITDFDLLHTSGDDLLTIRIKYGGSTVKTLAIENTAGGAITDYEGFLEILLLADGATNAQAIVTQFRVEQPYTAGSASSGVNLLHNKTTIDTGIAIDSTADQTFAVTVQFESASASNSITVGAYLVEAIKG